MLESDQSADTGAHQVGQGQCRLAHFFSAQLMAQKALNSWEVRWQRPPLDFLPDGPKLPQIKITHAAVGPLHIVIAAPVPANDLGLMS